MYSLPDRTRMPINPRYEEDTKIDPRSVYLRQNIPGHRRTCRRLMSGEPSTSPLLISLFSSSLDLRDVVNRALVPSDHIPWLVCALSPNHSLVDLCSCLWKHEPSREYESSREYAEAQAEGIVAQTSLLWLQDHEPRRNNVEPTSPTSGGHLGKALLDKTDPSVDIQTSSFLFPFFSQHIRSFCVPTFFSWIFALTVTLLIPFIPCPTPQRHEM